MSAIAHIGSVVTVTPSEEIQVIHGPGKYEIIDDRSPFVLKVSGFIEEKDEIIGVYGDVISGHERYRGLIATLLLRLDNSDWTRDNHSAAGFKVGRSPARLNGKHAFHHPHGTDIDGFPFIIRFGSVDSRVGSEQIINSAKEAFRESKKAAISKVRRYRPTDYQGLLAFLKNTHRELGYEFLPDGRHTDIRDLEDVYLNNRGSFHVIDNEGEIRGCVGVRKFSEEIAELKRFFIAQDWRGLGFGHALCINSIEDARSLGYKFLRLDTTTKSHAALVIFRKLGFCEIARYNSDPVAEIFMEKSL